ncbi:fructose-specific PTS transporter subunit EIIC [Sporolactobacillus sp. CQH2019]|uniref:fructose-specific PTS transporter subunit EIIC n=1 Tax=Sporolactobacillus sp. CQH2019 TaxID=3023512 RepID=UPI0023688D57|nr:fructose-specific PTS transporter subunit EIIC [Sporolactobacillus sp. CQH2019]MDD9148953.1 fructose-specific PTS transporter subunit EIIC [Sporolactobacillus sp. CQH2019]
MSYKIIAATGCPTGIAHTYMAQEALQEAAKKRNVSIKVETHGQSGVENALTEKEIKDAEGVIIAADIDVNPDRFAGKRVINVSVSKGMKDAEELVDAILNDSSIPVYKGNGLENATSGSSGENISSGFWHTLYIQLMNGVSHMIPVVVAGGVMLAVSFFWGINSADPKSSQYNQFAYMLNTLGGMTMNLMVPVLCAYIAEAIGKRAGLIAGFATGMLAFTNGTGFLGGIVGGFLAGYVTVLLKYLFKKVPKQLNGLKEIFIYPLLGVFISTAIMWFLSSPMKDINQGMMAFLKGMQNSDPIILGLIVGAMAAFDFGGPVNKAAYLTGVALLGQGNFYFMSGVSAACIAPPLATGFAVLLNRKAYTSEERNAGYVNFLLGSTHITEGAIPFAAKNPFLNIPSFMIGSAIAAILSYATKISDPAPHGGFIILPLVNHPLLWVLWIVIGALVSGILLALSAGKQARKNAVLNQPAHTADFKNSTQSVRNSLNLVTPVTGPDPGSILKKQNIEFDVEAKTREDVLKYLADLAVRNQDAVDSEPVYQKYLAREQQGSTGMEKGIAIPHAQDAAIKRSSMMILKLKTPIEWQTLDGGKIDTVISFLIPENSADHLKYLANVSKLLAHDHFIKQLKNAHSKEDIRKLFSL